MIAIDSFSTDTLYTEHTSPDPEYPALLEEMIGLRRAVARGAVSRLRALSWRDADGRYPTSARNLADYLALRCEDLRPLQLRLARKGLSSLGRVEAHVLASIDQVISVLSVLCGEAVPTFEPAPVPGFDAGNELLTIHARTLFGPPQPRRTARVMVTMPPEAASNDALLRSLMESGMDCARINCAHDDPETWREMVNNLRRTAQDLGRSCRILMDLAGHKIRTGALQDAPSRTRLRPRRDASGARVPVRILLRRAGEAAEVPLPEGVDLVLSGPDEMFAAVAHGDRLEFTDLRGRRRHWVMEREVPGIGWLACAGRKGLIGPETSMQLWRMLDGRWTRIDGGEIHLGGHSAGPVRIVLHPGDALLLTSPRLAGRPARFDDLGREIEPARIGITAPEILERLAPGQAVWIDDGKMGAVVEESGPEFARLRVTHSPPGGFRLRPDKGINLPGAALDLGPLSAKDLSDLDFVVRHADMVGFSFVESAADMAALMEELRRRDAGGLGIVAKIETERALRNLPDIMLSTIGRHPLALMIARGDLAVEIGGERLAEIQEEILWLAEAGHVPVIWATQVLETLAKTGSVSRPELSDAAMSGRAECVMLNKGPFIVAAVRVLDGILHRMQDHQQKKMPQLRALQLAVPREGDAEPAEA